MTTIYAVANQKGGVGKTTTCICLGAALAEAGKRVLLIDLDPQAGLTTGLGFDPEAFETTIYAALLDPESVKLAQVTMETKVPNLWLVPANLDLAGVEAELIGEIGWDRNLKELLSGARGSYDFVLIDCPPSLGVLTTNALIAAESVIVPVQTEYLAMRGLKQLGNIISKVKRKGNPQIQVKILRTMHDVRTIHAREVAEELERVFSEQIYQAVIRRTVKFADAALAGESILAYADSSSGAMAYRDLAKEILKP
jgi:chromosome partitioning protein